MYKESERKREKYVLRVFDFSSTLIPRTRFSASIISFGRELDSVRQHRSRYIYYKRNDKTKIVTAEEKSLRNSSVNRINRLTAIHFFFGHKPTISDFENDRPPYIMY